jgi:hypothetical protein
VIYGNDQNDEHIVKEMNKRFVITNIELIKEYEQKRKHHAFSLPLGVVTCTEYKKK